MVRCTRMGGGRICSPYRQFRSHHPDPLLQAPGTELDHLYAFARGEGVAPRARVSRDEELREVTAFFREKVRGALEVSRVEGAEHVIQDDHAPLRRAGLAARESLRDREEKAEAE